MRLPEFKLERFFARWEFEVQYLLCASDVEPLRLDELLALADAQCSALWRNLALGYTESAGHPLLRAEIARLYDAVSADEVLTFVGAQEAIFVVVNAALQPGDHAVAVWPAYQSLYDVARAAGAEVTLVPLDKANGWALDLDALRRSLRPNTRLIVVNFPHNPTGAHVDRTTFDAVVELARDAGCWLLSDEVYRGLEYNPAARLPAAVDVYDRAVSLGVMSKTYGLGGLRIGWIATHDRELIRRAVALKDYTTICSSAPSEILALIGLRAREQLVARSLGIVRANLARADRFFLEGADAFAWTPTAAGSVAFPELLLDMPIDRFIGELVEREGVLLLPGGAYDYPGNHFRLGLGRLSFPAAIERVERFVEGLAPRSRRPVRETAADRAREHA